MWYVSVQYTVQKFYEFPVIGQEIFKSYEEALRYFNDAYKTFERKASWTSVSNTGVDNSCQDAYFRSDKDSGYLDGDLAIHLSLHYKDELCGT